MVVFIEDVYPAPAEVPEDAFSAPPEINEQSYRNIVEVLEAAKNHLDNSSKCLSKCYSSAESSNKQFIRLRSELTELAIVYKDLHLPLATKVVTDLREVIMLLAEYDVKKFKKNIRGIEKSMSEQAVSAAVLTKASGLLLLDLNILHIHMEKKMISVESDAEKKRNDASTALEDAKRVKERYDAEKKKQDAEKRKCDAETVRYSAEAYDMKEKKKSAEIASGAGLVLGALAGVGAVLAAAPVLVAGAVAGVAVGVGGLACRSIAQDKGETATANRVKATADGKIAVKNRERAIAQGENAMTEGARAAKEATQEASECLKAVKLIKEMIRSLKLFTKAMEQVSEFLNLLASDTNLYAEKVKLARRQSDRMALHLKLIKKYEERIISACDLFVRFQIVVQGRCDSLPFLDGAEATDSTKNWCVKHKASGKIQQQELIVIQLLLGIESAGSAFENKQGKILQLLTKILSPKKRISK